MTEIAAERDAAPTEPQPEYALVEIYGHRKHAGRVCEEDRFGSKMLRIDIPKDGKFENGFTTAFYGGGSIFSYTPCDLAYVERANAPYQPASRLTYSAGDDEGAGDGDGEPSF